MANAELYADWIFYGGLAGAFGSAITIYIYARKKGVDNVTWIHSAAIITVFAFPTLILPILLLPGIPLFKKICVVVVLSLFGVARYYATTKGQEAVAKRREQKRKSNDSQV